MNNIPVKCMQGVGILHGACMELQHCSVHKNINTCVCVCGAGSSLTAQGCDMDEQPVAELGATALVR